MPKTHILATLIVMALLASLISIGGCATEEALPTPPPPAPASPAQAEPLSPAQIDSSMMDQIIEVEGEVVFVDKGPDGLFINIAGGGEEIGIFIENRIYQSMTEEQKAQFKEGQIVVVRGALVLEQGELTVLMGEEPPPEEKPKAVVASPTREPPAVPPANVSSPPPAEKVIELSYDITANPDSRWQEITLTVKDQDGNPVADTVISYEQKDIDFIYSTSAPAISAFGKIENGEWIPYPDREEQIKRYNDLGANNVEYYPWWLWQQAEPEDNKWNFKGAPGAPDDATVIDDGQFTDAENYYIDFPNVRFNTFWVGPQFNEPTMVPPWINYRDMEEFKKQFAEYITAAFNLNPAKHFDLYELTVEINDYPVWKKGAREITDEEWQAAIDFIGWEAELIRQLDPDAKIGIDFDPVVYFPEVPASHMTNWIDKIIEAGIDFDVIGLEIHPASFPNNPNDAEELKSLLSSLNVYEKEIYVWEYGVRSKGVPETPEFPTDWKAPVSEYSEEFQEKLYLETFKVFIENPKVIGVRYLVYKDPVEPTDSEYHSHKGKGFGLLKEDRTPKPSYYALRDYWHSLMVKGSATTNQDGEITFKAIPGIFKVTVGDQTKIVHIAK